MPLYEYKCQDCGYEFEELTSFAGADDVTCEKCGSKHTERLASTFSDSFAASGSDAPSCPTSGGG